MHLPCPPRRNCAVESLGPHFSRSVRKAVGSSPKSENNYCTILYYISIEIPEIDAWSNSAQVSQIFLTLLEEEEFHGVDQQETIVFDLGGWGYVAQPESFQG